jgi:predicted acyltransferase
MAQGKAPERLLSLDAVRGIAILLMMLSSAIPFTGDMPGWMFHAQTPPPTFRFDPTVPGITWVDLVFPMFLFAMGAAIPLSLSRRTAESQWKAVGGLIWRGALLGAFAFFSQHFQPRVIDRTPSPEIWWLAFGMFFVAILIWGLYPKSWSAWLRYGLQAVGWAIAIWVMFSLTWGDAHGPGPTVARSNPIILVLANMALFGGAIWLATRGSVLVRAGVMAAVLALFVGSTVPDSLSARIWEWTPLAWLTGWVYWKYLLLIIPGTILGDLLIGLRVAPDHDSPPAWRWWRTLPLSLACLALLVSILVVYYVRADWTVTLPLFAAIGLLALRPGDGFERSVAAIVAWSLAWLFFGGLMEPFQDGIKKDPATISYLLTMSGLSGLALAALMILERLRVALPVTRFVAASGQNALLAYAAISNLVGPIWHGTPLGAWVAERTPGPALGTVRGFMQVLLLAVLVWLFTKARIFMRA